MQKETSCALGFQSTLCTASFAEVESCARPVEPGKACEEVGPFCGAGRLLDRARLLLGVASRGKLLLMGPGPCLPTSDIASLDHCLLLLLMSILYFRDHLL